jgi:hypothetical protein
VRAFALGGRTTNARVTRSVSVVLGGINLVHGVAEVERAVRLIRSVATGRKITKVVTVEDTIVFCDVAHTQFVRDVCASAWDITDRRAGHRNHWEKSRRRVSIRKMLLHRPRRSREKARSALWHDGHAAGLVLVGHVCVHLMHSLRSRASCRCTIERLPGRRRMTGRLNS